MSSPTIISSFDPTGSFYAVASTKLSKNRVHVYSLGGSGLKSLNKIELDTTEKIESLCWINQIVPTTKRKRKQSQEAANGKEHDVTSYMAVAFSNGDLLVLSPFHREVVTKIVCESTVSDLTSLEKDNSRGEFYGVCQSHILKFQAVENRVLESLPFTQEKSLQFVRPIINKDQSESLLAGSNAIYVINRKEEPFRFSIPRGHYNKITNIVQSLKDPDFILCARENDASLFVYSLSKKTNTGVLKAGSKVGKVYQLLRDNIEYLAITCVDGSVEVFADPFTTDSESCLQLKPSDPSFKIHDVCFNGEELMLTFLSDMEPTAQFVAWDDSLSGEIIVDCDNEEEDEDDEMKVASSDERDEEEEGEEEEEEQEVYVAPEVSELASSICESISNVEEVAQVCKQNSSDEEVVRKVVQRINLPASSELVTILGTEFMSQPQDSNLSVWVKWLILTYGSAFTKSRDHMVLVSSIRSLLDKELENMPKLLSLQGRLELLKAQLQLRKEMRSVSLEEEAESEVLPNGNSVVYVNGENDEEVDEDAAPDGEEEDN